MSKTSRAEKSAFSLFPYIACPRFHCLVGLFAQWGEKLVSNVEKLRRGRKGCLKEHFTQKVATLFWDKYEVAVKPSRWSAKDTTIIYTHL